MSLVLEVNLQVSTGRLLRLSAGGLGMAVVAMMPLVTVLVISSEEYWGSLCLIE
jgi:hypothetical protein